MKYYAILYVMCGVLIGWSLCKLNTDRNRGMFKKCNKTTVSEVIELDCYSPDTCNRSEHPMWYIWPQCIEDECGEMTGLIEFDEPVQRCSITLNMAEIGE